MRVALWFMGLFGAAVALALFAGENEGTVTVFWPPHRVDMSVNLVLLLLLAAFALLYFGLRAFAAMVELPRQARRWRSQQRERAVQRHFRGEGGVDGASFPFRGLGMVRGNVFGHPRSRWRAG